MKHIHDSGFIHLDVKPANVLISFEGVLKIADFGMATYWPAERGIEGEGDREYIGPEILMGQFDKPADIFALGLMMLEIAGNVMLPDQGASWQRLRNGDMADVPSLTSGSEASNVTRDSDGNPITPIASFYDAYGCDTEKAGKTKYGLGAISGNLVSAPSFVQEELLAPPDFMDDPENEHSLDKLVRWMISPAPLDRPTVNDLLVTVGVTWAEKRRRAGATIYEGNWGPADSTLQADAEMIDV